MLLSPLTRLLFVVRGERRLVRPVPDRDAVPPPQLAGDAPIVDVLHPLEVQLLPAVWDEAHPPVAHSGDCLLGERLHAHEPLGGDDRLHSRAAALAVADGVRVGDDLLQCAFLFERGDHRLLRLFSRHSGEAAAVLVDPPLFSEDVDCFQVVALADREVDRVVRRGDLEDARPELGIDLLRRNDR